MNTLEKSLGSLISRQSKSIGWMLQYWTENCSAKIYLTNIVAVNNTFLNVNCKATIISPIIKVLKCIQQPLFVSLLLDVNKINVECNIFYIEFENLIVSWLLLAAYMLVTFIFSPALKQKC